MLLLVAGVAPAQSLAAAIAIRESVESSLPVAIVDGAGLEAGSGGLDRAALCELMEGVIDAHERVRPHSVVATVPAAWADDPARLAFFLRRRHDQRAAIVRFERAAVGGGAALGLSGPESAEALEPWTPVPLRIDSDRLVLTVPTPEQVAAYYHEIRGSRLFDTLCWDGPAGVEEMLDWRVRSQRLLAKGRGHAAGLGIIERASGRQIGGASLRPRDPDDARADIGYAIVPALQGRGYGGEAVGALVRYAIEERGCRRLEAEVFVGNEASRRLLERLGFELEGTRRQQIAKGGRLVDEWVFGLTRDRWSG